MKVLVCGGRDFYLRALLFKTLDDLDASCSGIATIVVGGARGADSLAEDWSRARQIKRIIYPAEWNRYNKQAGVMRNQKMLDQEKPDLIVAFAGGRGTSHMVTIAKRGGYEVLEISASGCPLD